MVVRAHVAHARQRLELGRRDRAREPQLDLVVGEVAQGVDAVDLGEPAVADDRDPVAGPLDLGQDVARQEDRPAVGHRLADELEERLLDERVETRRRLVEDQQLGSVLERDDEPDLLLVALGVLLEPARRVEVEAFDQRAPGRPRSTPPRRLAKYSIVWAPVSRSYRLNSPGR